MWKGFEKYEEAKCENTESDRGDYHLSSHWGGNIWQVTITNANENENTNTNTNENTNTNTNINTIFSLGRQYLTGLQIQKNTHMNYKYHLLIGRRWLTGLQIQI